MPGQQQVDVWRGHHQGPVDGLGHARRLDRLVSIPLATPHCLGRYAFTTQPLAELRLLRDPNARDGEDDESSDVARKGIQARDV